MPKPIYARTALSPLEIAPADRAPQDTMPSVRLGAAAGGRTRALVVAASGDLDIATMGPLRAAALGAVTAAHRKGNRPIHLVLDWEGVEFLDSSAVHFLEDICAEGLLRGWAVQVLPPSAPSPARLLRLAVDRGWLPRNLVAARA